MESKQYRHKESGRIYELLHVANFYSDLPDWPLTAVYRDVDGNIWARPLDKFIERCEAIDGDTNHV